MRTNAQVDNEDDFPYFSDWLLDLGDENLGYPDSIFEMPLVCVVKDVKKKIGLEPVSSIQPSQSDSEGLSQSKHSTI
jgi:hypothetical protein